MAKQLFPVLKNFPPVLTQVLAVPDGETSDCGLKMEVLKVSLVEKINNKIDSTVPWFGIRITVSDPANTITVRLALRRM